LHDLDCDRDGRQQRAHAAHCSVATGRHYDSVV
jgi:hypothetical protein